MLELHILGLFQLVCQDIQHLIIYSLQWPIVGINLVIIGVARNVGQDVHAMIVIKIERSIMKTQLIAVEIVVLSRIVIAVVLLIIQIGFADIGTVDGFGVMEVK